MLEQRTISIAEKPYLFPGNINNHEYINDAELTESAVIRFVQKIGIRPNLAGYHLLISSIKLAISRPELMNSMTRGLYPSVAMLHGCDVKAVERNIRRAIESAYDYDPERVRSVFYYKVGKPYISEVISMAVESIRYEDTKVLTAVL